MTYRLLKTATPIIMCSCRIRVWQILSIADTNSRCLLVTISSSNSRLSTITFSHRLPCRMVDQQESWVWLYNSSKCPKAYQHLKHYSKEIIQVRRQRLRCTAISLVNIKWYKDSKHLMASDKSVWFSHRMQQVEDWLRWRQPALRWFKIVAVNNSMWMRWQCKIVKAMEGLRNSML